MGKAAEREHISTTAISKRIIELEQQLGIALLERQNVGVRVTPAGAAVAVEVRQVLAMLDGIRARVDEYTSGQQGEVTILFSPSGPLGSLPSALKSFLELHPHVDIRLEERRAPRVIEGIAQGDGDIGIFARQAESGELAMSRRLSVRPYESFRLVLVAPADHPLAGRAAVSFEEAANYDFVLFPGSGGIGSLLRRVSHERGFTLKGHLQVTTFDSARRMVQAGLGVTIMCAPSVEPMAAASGLKSIPLTDAWAEFGLSICTKLDDTLAKPARLMLAHLIQSARPDVPRASAPL